MAPPLSKEVITDSSEFSESDDSEPQLKKKEPILKKKGTTGKSNKARSTTQAAPSESSQSSSEASSSEESSSEESSSEDSDTSSEDGDDSPSARLVVNARGKQNPASFKPGKPATALTGEKPAIPSQTEESGNKSSKYSAFIPKTRIVVPRGFKPINPTRSSDMTNLFRNLERKEIWHISAPSDTTLDSIKEIPWSVVNTDKPVLTQKGVSYCFRSEPAQFTPDEIMLLPAQNENLYYGYQRLLTRNFLLQEIMDIPSGPSEEQVHMSTIQKQNGKRKAPKNLRMRYRPYPSEDGPPIDLGAMFESESEAEETNFKYPPGSDVKKGNRMESAKGNKKEGKKEGKKEDDKESRKERKVKGRNEGREESKKESKKADRIADQENKERKKESKKEGGKLKEDKKGDKQKGKKRKHTEAHESPTEPETASQGDGAELPRKKSKKRHTSHDEGNNESSPHEQQSSSKPMDEGEETRSKKSRKEGEKTSEVTSEGRKARKEEKKQKKLEKKGKLKA